MGSWRFWSFENDIALDYVDQLTGSEPLVQSINCCAQSAKYYDVFDASEAIAAATIIAAALGKPPKELPMAAETAITKFKNFDLAVVKKAKAALGNVKGHSELTDLWRET